MRPQPIPFSRLSFSITSALTALCLVACGGDAAAPITPETTPAGDAAAGDGAAVKPNGASDAGGSDATSADADVRDAADTKDAADAQDASEIPDAASPDAAIADGGACHARAFGAARVQFEHVPNIPAYTGGTIPPGTYDNAAVESTTASHASPTYTFRATWVFQASGAHDALTQIQLGSALGEPVRLSGTWSTAAGKLTRAFTCGGSTSQTNDYTVESVNGETFLRYGSRAVRFSLKKR